MEKAVSFALLVFICVKSLFAADVAPLETYSPDLSKISSISCTESQIDKQTITALPQQSGAIMIPVNKADLRQYNRIRIKITPLNGNFLKDSFAVALRKDREYFFAHFISRPPINGQTPFEMTLDIATLPRENVDFIRLYFNRDGKINDAIKFKIDEVGFYKNIMISKLPQEEYHRKLNKTFVFPRIQIKYSMFMNYYSAAFRDLWIERPLLFNRELTADTRKFEKKGNFASFRKNADIVSSYLDGFSILATSQSYLSRTLAAMQYADKLNLKNFLLMEISPDISSSPQGMRPGKNLEFIFELAKAAEASPSAFRISDKVVISSYNADLLKPEQWRPIIQALKKQNGDRLLFIAEIRAAFYKVNREYIKNGGKISLEEVHNLKNYIRSYLEVADGVLFAGCNHLVKETNEISSYKFGNEFYKNILIPAMISVINEPQYRSKYLGLSAAKGYFYVRHADGGQNEVGTLTLRQSLEASLGVNPDFIIMPEWNEANENTHIEPTVYDSFTNRRIINYYRKTANLPEENHSLPNLIVSYRSELGYGETLTIELLTLPDPNYNAENVKIELCLKNSSGEVVKRFNPLTLSNLKLDEKYFKIPVEEFGKERVLIPELSVSVDGKMQPVKGLSYIMLKTPPCMNKKYVKQPIRDLCGIRQLNLCWDKTADGVKLKGTIETESPLNTVELLENNVPVAAVDLRKEYQCGPDEVLLRFCWNGGVNSNKALPCVIKPISGSVNVLGHKSITMDETKNGAPDKKGAVIQKQLLFTSHVDEFFFKADKNSELMISIGNREIRFSVAELLEFGIYRKVFNNSDMISVEQVRRLPELPYPINEKRLDFSLTAKSIFSLPVYTVRAITIDGKIFRSQPFYSEKLSGRTIHMNVWSYSKQKVLTLNLPEEYGNKISYDFNPEAGDVLPTAGRCRFYYAKLGGFDVWNTHFNSPDTASAPSWKMEADKSVLEFDGVGNYLVFPPSLISRQSFTLAFSIMPRNHSKQVIFQTYSSPHPGFQLILENGILSGYFLNRQGQSFKFTTNTQLKIGAWNDVSICYDMEKISFKINGGMTESFPCHGLLYRQPCLIFGGSYPSEGAHRFQGRLRSFLFANYMLK